MRTLAELERRLQGHTPRAARFRGAMRQAAVAAVFREKSDLELLFIQRAEHPRDPWSGHMAFPGGRVGPGDPDALAAARRETREEVGVDLDAAGRLVAELSPVRAVAHRKPVPMVIVPFVFVLEQSVDLSPDPREVQDALWVPWSFLAQPTNRQSMPQRFAGVPMHLPCVPYKGRTIWGLTLKMVDELRSLVA